MWERCTWLSHSSFFTIRRESVRRNRNQFLRYVCTADRAVLLCFSNVLGCLGARINDKWSLIAVSVKFIQQRISGSRVRRASHVRVIRS